MRICTKVYAAWAIFSVIGLGSGCSHYYLPANHLETPEVSGPDRVGRLEILSFQSGTDLISPAQLTTPAPTSSTAPVAVLQEVTPSYTFGFDVATTESLDLGVKVGVDVPLTIVGKYQVYGAPESRAQARNLSAAVMISPGVLNSNGVLYYLVDAAVPVGYRIWQNHLLSLTPFFSFGGISGVSIPAVPSPSGSGVSSPATTSATFDQYGIALGYQYTLLAIHLRGELSYLGGAMQTAQIGGFYAGASLGFNL